MSHHVHVNLMQYVGTNEGIILLTARRVSTAPAGRHSDGNGLYLFVKQSGLRSWVLRYQVDGRRRDMGLGAYPEVTLARAREKALDARRLIKDQGIDPIDQRRRAVRQVGATVSFRTAAESLIASKAPGWKSRKHADQWTSTLEQYVFPEIGHKDISTIETTDVLAVLKPIWVRIPETASRIRQRIEAILDFATASGAREGSNPARWRGHLNHLLAAPTKVRPVRHHPALNWQDLPEFVVALRRLDGIAPRALEFTILTAARSGETRGMTWGEIDFDDRVWRIPSERIKTSREHRVPLNATSLAVLGEPRRANDLVFPGPSLIRPLSDMAMTAVLRRMNRNETVHGFRSSFRDWAGETTGFPREVIEAALAHRLKDKAEAAYARGDLFAKRRRLMDEWASFVTELLEVVSLDDHLGRDIE